MLGVCVTDNPNGHNLPETLKGSPIQAVRIELHWADIQPAHDRFDYSHTDRLLEPLLKAGLHVTGILAQGYLHCLPGWVSAGNHDRYFDLLETMIEKTVARYPDVAAWEIDNMPNIAYLWDALVLRRRSGRFWGRPDFWRNSLRRGCEAIRLTNPNADIVQTVFTGLPGWRGWARALGRWGVEYDVLGLNSYPNYFRPTAALTEKIRDEVRSAAEIKNRIWLTEWGFPAYTRRFNVHVQQETLARGIGILEGGAVEAAYWFCLHDLPDERVTHGYRMPRCESFFGLLEADGTPRPAWKSLTTTDPDSRGISGKNRPQKS